jgi:23S rRNA (uracil1939-C5)-methyltransferase
VFDVRQCHLQPDPSNAVRQAVKKIALAHGIPFFDLRAQTGYVRTLTLRTTTTQQVMVILQVAFDQPEWLNVLLTGLQEQFPTITSFNYVINTKRNDTFNDLPVITWKGTPYIIERMAKPDGNGHLDFRIGPKSFYQTNAEQAEVLYRHAWMLAGLTGKEVVYDLYTGTGTIANYVAPFAKTVIGLEYVPDAIEDAKVNSQINGITNTHFFAGDMKDLLNDAFLQHHGKPDVVITDPPRAGMHENVCAMLLNAAPTRIVYVSCNPATQARDLKLLAPHYNVTAVQPVDMFPHTMHVENIALLERK